MSNIFFMDSFDHYAPSTHLNKWEEVMYANSGVVAVTGRDGTGQAFKLQVFASEVGMYLTFDNQRYPTFTMAGGIKKNFRSTNRIVYYMEMIVPRANYYIVSKLYLVSDVYGNLSFYYTPSTDPNAPVSSQFASRPIPYEQWCHLAFNVTFGSFAGIQNVTGKIYLNEELILDETISGWPNEDYQGINIFGLGNGVTIDDFYLTEGDIPGDLKIGVIRPESDVSAAWTRSGGAANFEMVDDDSMDSDSTYNATSTIGNKDIFEMEDIATDVTVHACQALLAAKKDSEGTANVRMIWKPGGVEYPDPNYYPDYLTYQFDRVVRTVNPDTSVDWTPAEVNALKMGYEKMA